MGKDNNNDDDDFLSSSCCSSESPPASFVEQQHGDSSNNNSASNAADVVLPSEAAFQDVRDIRLNYIITQVDISRMARNASRHLDVKSILSLPTIVYQEPQQQGKEEEDDDGNES